MKNTDTLIIQEFIVFFVRIKLLAKNLLLLLILRIYYVYSIIIFINIIFIFIYIYKYIIIIIYTEYIMRCCTPLKAIAKIIFFLNGTKNAS